MYIGSMLVCHTQYMIGRPCVQAVEGWDRLVQLRLDQQQQCESTESDAL